MTVEEKSAWGLETGDAVVPGRLALSRLGGGERFETYLCWDSFLFTTVVAKVLRPAFVEHDRARRDLRREAEHVFRLNHPIIVRGYDLVDDGPRPHLVLEHLDGPTLRSTMRRQRGKVSLEEVLPLALHLCSALHYLGGMGVVHLDIKPLNIIMGPVPRLIDFSIARDRAAARRISPNTGTRLYMAPEQCVPGERGEVGPPADMWALGACVFQALAGRRPYAATEAERPAGHPQLRDGGPDALPPDTPPLLAAAVLHCLDPDASARPTPAELALQLEPVIAGLAAPRFSRRGLRYRT